MTEKQEEQIQWAVRLPESFLKRVDKLAEQMSKPAMKITRTDVLRIAMYDGVEGLEATEKKKR